MFQRSDGGFHSGSQILPIRTRIMTPLAPQGHFHFLRRKTQHTLERPLEQLGSTLVGERTALTASGFDSNAIAMGFSPWRHFRLLSIGTGDRLGLATAWASRARASTSSMYSLSSCAAV